MNVHVAPPARACGPGCTAHETGPRFVPPGDTRAAQAEASDPGRSAWVSANAGSGKTHVLKARVLRLLLEGVDPARILCLTYTRLAAAEMAQRVFGELARWATLCDCRLTEEILALEGVDTHGPDVGGRRRARVRDRVDRARTLFAHALETPGGLKIQTIHAFCESVLHRFPLEANVPARFSVIEDDRRAELMREARGAMWTAAHAGDERLATAAERARAVASDQALEEALDETIARREHLVPWLRATGGPDEVDAALRRRFGLAPGTTGDSLKTAFWGEEPPLSRDDVAGWAGRAAEGTARADANFAAVVGEAWATGCPVAAFDACVPLFLTAGGTVRKTVLSKMVCGEEADRLQAHGEALAEALEDIAMLEVVSGSAGLFTLADDLLGRYEEAKARAGLMDFDDVIARTGDLLEREGAGAWVHYKLDRGLDHVLVDEAQDTSPRQWRIVARLVEEFLAGDGAHEALRAGPARTVFAVGDEKQSIFSFQGTEPAAFERTRRSLQTRAAEPRQFDPVRLNLSFRSVQDVLDAVDRTFADGDNARGLTTGDYAEHVAARRGQRGHVEIWPRVTSADRADEPEDWTAPVDAVGEAHPALRLADRVADRIASLVARETLVAREDGRDAVRPVTPGDVLVLVRSRDAFAPALARALKARGVAVAGADRLALAGHVAVRDLLALARTVLLPADDLSLAAVLKSPLWGLDEDELFALARAPDGSPRTGTLWDRLADARDGPAARALAELETLRRLADRVPVHEFYAHLLGPMGGRRRFFARLGTGAEDVLDAFVQATLEHETSADGPGGLQTFVNRMEATAAEVKREMDGRAREVRIMTVHAAKGLQAPVVFLVDRGSRPFDAGKASRVMRDAVKGNETFVWVPSSDRLTRHTRPLRERDEADALAEYRRLLYVGMTRAADRLIVCGYGREAARTGGAADETWHDMVTRALEGECDEVPDEVAAGEGGTLLRFPKGAVAASPRVGPEASAEPLPPVPGLPPDVLEPMPPQPRVPRPLTPVGSLAFLDAVTLRGGFTGSLLPDGGGTGREDRGIARRRGTLAHRLLQALPDLAPDERRGTALRFLRAMLPATSEEARARLADEVLTTIDEFGSLFGPGSRAEVAVRGALEVDGETVVVSGRIDRLVVGEDVVTIADYKTGHAVPDGPADVPDDTVRQIAIYRALVGRIFDRPVRALLIWTHADGGPRVMEMPEAADDRFTSARRTPTSRKRAA